MAIEQLVSRQQAASTACVQQLPEVRPRYERMHTLEDGIEFHSHKDNDHNMRL
jgi:hypothetical protein